MNRTRILSMIGLTLLLVLSCEGRWFGQSAKTSVHLDRARLCQAGGAEWSAATNECVCSGELMWNGYQCISIPTAAPAPVVSEPRAQEVAAMPAGVPPADLNKVSAGEGAEDAHTDAVQPAPVADEPAADEVPGPEDEGRDVTGRSGGPVSSGAGLSAACRRAGGRFVAADQYCFCPAGKVLMGRRCVAMSGRMTDDLCQRAVSPGRFVRGRCFCPAARVFVPELGGCADSVPEEKNFLRRVCENSLNRGRWDSAGDFCRCPDGKIFAEGYCERRDRLPSRLVCESRENGGSWVASQKSCRCPDGRLWMDQTCAKLQGVSDEKACRGETNGGTWDAAKSSCFCPAGSKWSLRDKRCIRQVRP